MSETVAKSELFRLLPSVDDLLRSTELSERAARSRQAATDAARTVIDKLRRQIADGSLDGDRVEARVGELASEAVREFERAREHSLRRVINATGVVLHTNLGRAPLSEAAIEHLREASCGYSNLEFDLASGERSKRDVHVDRLFKALFRQHGEFSTVVVNNNAAAVLLGLNSLAEGGEVIVSRGELVEIGGSFRIPDVMAKSGAVLREVGTTNRTRISDYARALNERTRLILRVHRSNFEMVGFTEQPSLRELVILGREHGIPVMDDLGSGALFDLASIGVHGEPGVRESLDAGVDVVTYSGDKLLGGPQCGMLSGRPDLVARIRSNPLFRALRVDKLTYSVLESTLLAYVSEELEAIPAVRMMKTEAARIAERAEAVIRQVRGNGDLTLEMMDGESLIGGGAAPTATLPTALITLECAGLTAEELAKRLRLGDPPVVTRVEADRVLLDLRTVLPEEDSHLVAVLNALHAR